MRYLSARSVWFQQTMLGKVHMRLFTATTRRGTWEPVIRRSGRPVVWTALVAMLCISVPRMVSAQQTPELIGSHGSVCQPANLGQAINFQTNWSQFGVRNVNPLGSGRNFFVVCPVTVTDDASGINPSSIVVNIRYEDRDGVNRVGCTAVRADALSGGFLKVVSKTDDTPGTGSASVTLELKQIADEADRAFNLLTESYAVICALVPRSGIRGIVFDHN